MAKRKQYFMAWYISNDDGSQHEYGSGILEISSRTDPSDVFDKAIEYVKELTEKSGLSQGTLTALNKLD